MTQRLDAGTTGAKEYASANPRAERASASEQANRAGTSVRANRPHPSAGSASLAIAAALAAAVAFSACASGGDRTASGTPVYAIGEVDVRPVLVGCSGYDPIFTQSAPGGPLRYVGVEVRFVVDALGNVEPGSLAFTATRPEAESAVIQAARGCAYKPALLNGEAVAVRTTRYFRIPIETVLPEKVQDSAGGQSPIAPPRVVPGASDPSLEGSPR
jgi:hypothetical protein